MISPNNRNSLKIRKKRFTLTSIVISLLIISCSGKTTGISDFTTGQSLDSAGKIKDNSLIYTLKEYKQSGKNRDLFNYIYFQGDTFCFSFKVSESVIKENIEVHFYDPLQNITFTPERIDISDNRYYGFTLLGTLMEKLYAKRLEETVDSKMFCCRDRALEIIVSVLENNVEKKYRFKKVFRINYR